jgi:hypothetical protein
MDTTVGTYPGIILIIIGMFILLESRLGDRCGAGIIPLIYPVWSRRYNSFPGQ